MAQAFFPACMSNCCHGLHNTFSNTCTKLYAHSLSDPLWNSIRSHTRRILTPNICLYYHIPLHWAKTAVQLTAPIPEIMNAGGIPTGYKSRAKQDLSAFARPYKWHKILTLKHTSILTTLLPLPETLTVKVLGLFHEKLAALFPLSLQQLIQTLRDASNSSCITGTPWMCVSTVCRIADTITVCRVGSSSSSAAMCWSTWYTVCTANLNNTIITTVRTHKAHANSYPFSIPYTQYLQKQWPGCVTVVQQAMLWNCSSH